MRDRARTLDVRLPTNPTVLVIQHADGGPCTPARFDQIREQLETLASGPLVGTVAPDHNVFIVGEIDAAPLARLLDAAGLRAGSHAAHDPARIGAAFQAALTALRSASADVWFGRALLTDGDVQLLAVLAGHMTLDTHSFIDHVLGQLCDEDCGHLLEALTVYLGTGNAVVAAATCHIHPQSLRYRLRRIKGVIARDLDNVWDRFVLGVACRAVAADQSGG
jgi:hypothetical protein